MPTDRKELLNVLNEILKEFEAILCYTEKNSVSEYSIREAERVPRVCHEETTRDVPVLMLNTFERTVLFYWYVLTKKIAGRMIPTSLPGRLIEPEVASQFRPGTIVWQRVDLDAFLGETPRDVREKIHETQYGGLATLAAMAYDPEELRRRTGMNLIGIKVSEDAPQAIPNWRMLRLEMGTTTPNLVATFGFTPNRHFTNPILV